MEQVVQTTYRPKLSIQKGTKLYIDLHKRINENKILNRSYTYYGVVGGVVLLGMIASVFGLVIFENTIMVIIFGLCFAFFAGQIGGFMHDAGHQAIFKSKKKNDILGNICASMLFFNYNFWTKKHNLHHAHPNQEGKDPDIEIPLFSFNKKRYDSKKGIFKLLQKYQAYLYFPFSILLVYTMHFGNNVKYFIREFRKGFRPIILLEIAIVLTFFFIWYMLPFLIFTLAKAIIIILVVPLGISLYLANVFAPNHKGMPELDNETQISFLEQQIATSRNIKSNWFTDILYFGLHFQIEHHLFPNCPRNKLKLITPYLKEICRQNGLPYSRVGVIESFKIILSSLNEVAHA